MCLGYSDRYDGLGGLRLARVKVMLLGKTLYSHSASFYVNKWVLANYVGQCDRMPGKGGGGGGGWWRAVGGWQG